MFETKKEILARFAKHFLDSQPNRVTRGYLSEVYIVDILQKYIEHLASALCCLLSPLEMHPASSTYSKKIMTG